MKIQDMSEPGDQLAPNLCNCNLSEDVYRIDCPVHGTNAPKKLYRPETWWERDASEGLNDLRSLCIEMGWGKPGEDIFKIVCREARKMKYNIPES